MKKSEIYVAQFETQSGALYGFNGAFKYAQSLGYIVVEPILPWREDLEYNSNVSYRFALKLKKTGNFARKNLQVNLCIGLTGHYILTTYLN